MIPNFPWAECKEFSSLSVLLSLVLQLGYPIPHLWQHFQELSWCSPGSAMKLLREQNWMMTLWGLHAGQSLRRTELDWFELPWLNLICSFIILRELPWSACPRKTKIICTSSQLSLISSKFTSQFCDPLTSASWREILVLDWKISAISSHIMHNTNLKHF